MANDLTSSEFPGYDGFLNDLKGRIQAAQTRAALAVNRELILLYWEIGTEILARQSAQGWGAKVVDRLARDLRAAFPEMKGFSRSNLHYMRSFAEAWPDAEFVQQLAGQIPWFHHCVLLDKVKSRAERVWYVRAAAEHGWSRNVLVHQIETKLHERQGKAHTNFSRTLPAPDSDLAHELLKNPYVFDFLTLADALKERALEKGLLEHIRLLLMELGQGFAFVGSQYHVEVDGRDFYIDLLFYHLRLRCYVVVDLKVGEFEPEYAGKMNFYLAAVDAQVRHESDRRSVGLILCKTARGTIVEYALSDSARPLGVAEYRLGADAVLPEGFRESLPNLEDLQAVADALPLPETEEL